MVALETWKVVIQLLRDRSTSRGSTILQAAVEMSMKCFEGREDSVTAGAFQLIWRSFRRDDALALGRVMQAIVLIEAG